MGRGGLTGQPGAAGSALSAVRTPAPPLGASPGHLSLHQLLASDGGAPAVPSVWGGGDGGLLWCLILGLPPSWASLLYCCQPWVTLARASWPFLPAGPPPSHVCLQQLGPPSLTCPTPTPAPSSSGQSREPLSTVSPSAPAVPAAQLRASHPVCPQVPASRALAGLALELPSASVLLPTLCQLGLCCLLLALSPAGPCSQLSSPSPNRPS